MLTAWDELMCHQMPATMDHVHTTNPEWTERVYVSIYNVRDKNTILGFGVGQYPNKNVQDGFATVWHEDRQYNFRASRALRPRIDEVKVGPLSVETLEGLRRFRIKLDDNPSTIRLDIEWTARDEIAKEPSAPAPPAPAKSLTRSLTKSLAPDAIDALIRLGQIGHFRGISATLDEIEAASPECAACVAELRAIANSFNLTRFLTVLDAQRRT